MTWGVCLEPGESVPSVPHCSGEYPGKPLVGASAAWWRASRTLRRTPAATPLSQYLLPKGDGPVLVRVLTVVARRVGEADRRYASSMWWRRGGCQGSVYRPILRRSMCTDCDGLVPPTSLDVEVCVCPLQYCSVTGGQEPRAQAVVQRIAVARSAWALNRLLIPAGRSALAAA